MFQLSTPDLFILVLYFVLMSGLGVYLARFQTDSRSYFLSNRNIPWWAVCLSIVATETSVLTFIGVPAMSYDSDMRFLQITLGYLVARVILALFFLPAFLSQETYTVYGYLTRRFGPRARNIAAGLFFISQMLGHGVRLFASALVLSAVLGLNGVGWSIFIMAAVTVFYTWAGGISAVIWTDVIQGAIMLGGAVLALVILGGMFPEGAGPVLATAQAAGKLRLFDFGFDLSRTYTFWSGLVGGTFLGMASHGTDQVLAQRLLTCRSLGDGRKALVGSAFIIIPQFAAFLLIGVLLYYFYQAHPPATAFAKSDSIFPHFIVNHFPPVAAGLTIAAIFGAAMSTLSGALQAFSSSAVMDILKPLRGEAHANDNYLGVSRWFTIFWGAVLCGIAFLARNWGPVLETGLTVASVTYGPLLGLFLLGFFTRLKSLNALTAGVLAGLAAVVLVLRSHVVPWTWYVAIGATVTVVASLAVERISGARGSCR